MRYRMGASSRERQGLPTHGKRVVQVVRQLLRPNVRFPLTPIFTAIRRASSLVSSLLAPIFSKPESQTAMLVNVDRRSILCCHRYGRLVIRSTGTTLGANPVTSSIQKGRDREVVIDMCVSVP